MRKACSKCGVSKPTGEFHKDSSKTDGLRRDCKECVRVRLHDYYERNREREVERQKAHRDANSERLAQEAKTRYWANRDREVLARRRRREENPEPGRQRAKCYYWAHRDQALQRVKQYQHDHPESQRCRSQTRRARKANAEGTFDTDAVAQRSALWGHRCYLCGGKSEAIDHVKPLAAGGSNWPSNLRPICRSCNSRKRSTWPYHVPAGPYAAARAGG